MTNEQINAAIAEACGWTECGEDSHWELKRACMVNPLGHIKVRPRYATELNAMHDAIATLTVDQREQMICNLYLIRADERHQTTHLDFDATASQRAEAFLRTVGKWQD